MLHLLSDENFNGDIVRGLLHDRSTLPDFAFSRVENSEPMPGVFVLNDRRPERDAIDELLMVDECSEQAEWSGLVVYLPL